MRFILLPLLLAAPLLVAIFALGQHPGRAFGAVDQLKQPLGDGGFKLV